MFTNDKRQVERTGKYGTPRAEYLQELVTEFQTTTDEVFTVFPLLEAVFLLKTAVFIVVGFSFGGRTVSVGRRSINFPKEIMAGRKVEVLEGELGQLKTDFEEKISDFQNQFSSIHEKMDGRFAALEDLMKKMIDDKQKSASSETIGGHGRGGNPNPSRGRENPEVEVLEGDDGMPPLEPLSREELSRGYNRQEAEYVGREEFYHRGAGFERIQRRGTDFEGERADFHRRGADFERIQRRGADFEGRREEIHRRGADFEGIQRRESKEKVVAHLANFAYDPYNYNFLRQLNVLELFLDCITEENERLIEFGVGGICNSCVVQCDGIPLVIQCLSSPVRNTVNYALGALYYLCNSQTKEEILKPEVVEVIRKYAAAEAVSVGFSNLANAFLEKHVKQ
ncbi:hypothetical protein M5K25_003341 [Dendrobium thyrsiflorum]|uniref:Uncharacterized protein n=1 Tax=Dendrobium thyrsiflorum TaxID=117978 RepID=A0ABD0VIZ3_DENTH